MSEPIVLRGGTVLTMNDAHEVLHDADVPGPGRQDRRGRAGPRGPGGHHRDRRVGRHRDAGHDRHAPPHVADRPARLRRRLDAGPVLRLLLPRVREDLPPAGHRRGQHAVGDRVARRRRHHHRRLVARAADRRSRRRRRRRAARRSPAGSCSPTATSSRARGSGRRRPTSAASSSAASAAADDMLGFQMAFDVTGDPAFPEQEAFKVARELDAPVTTHAGVWGATNDDGIRLMHEHGFMTPGEHLRPRGDADRGLLPPDRGDRRLASPSRPRASRAPARATRRRGSCASTTSRSRCRWTRACGGAATCSARCARRSAPTARREHLEAHAKQADTVTNHHLRAEQVVDWATRGGSQGARHGRA